MRSMVGFETFSRARPNAAHVSLARLEEGELLAHIVTQNVRENAIHCLYLCMCMVIVVVVDECMCMHSMCMYVWVGDVYVYEDWCE